MRLSNQIGDQFKITFLNRKEIFLKKRDLEPTEENIIDSFVKNSVGRNNSLLKFIEMLNYQDDSYSIAFDGRWGSGKTFFVKQCKLVLDCLNEENQYSYKDQILDVIGQDEIAKLTKINFKTVYFDAWKNDSDLDPIVSLSKSIATTAFNIKTKAKTVAIEAGKELVKIAAKEIAKIDIDSILDIFHTEENVEAKFKKELASLIPKNGRLIVFIDELDRCRPTYAVKLLERVQHFFDNKKITFIFSVNLYELKNTIKKLYGSSFDGDRYLDRFFYSIISLPDANYTSENIQGMSSDEKMYLKYCDEISQKFNFSLREQNHFTSMIDITGVKNRFLSFNYQTDVYGNGDQIVDLFIIPYLIAIKMVDSDLLRDFVVYNDEADFVDFLSSSDAFSIYLRSEDSNIRKKAAKSIYDCIFVKYELGNSVVIIKDPLDIYIEKPYKLKKEVNDILSLVSDFSVYEDKDAKPTKK